MGHVSEIVALREHRGRRACGGEPVSPLEHALQAAHQAERAGAPDWLITAAMLHDVGHLLDDPADAPAGADRHEWLGARLVAPLAGRPVARVIALHVKAKRHLCAVDPSDLRSLSPGSLRSLTRQGGVLTPDEIDAFERHPYHREAVPLRRWDDEAKVGGRPAPGLEYYRPKLEAARRQAAAVD